MSDEDFFSDEEPAAKARQPEKQGRAAARKPAPQPPARRKGAPTPPAPFFDRRTTYAVTLLIAVIGLLAGVLGGYLYGSSSAQSSSTASPSARSAPVVVPASAATTTP